MESLSWYLFYFNMIYKFYFFKKVWKNEKKLDSIEKNKQNKKIRLKRKNNFVKNKLKMNSFNKHKLNVF